MAGEDAPKDPLTRVGRFEIHSLLGKGGMASVYRAFDPTLDRVVALKVLHPSDTAEPDDAEKQRKRVLREARAAAAFSHPNTVTIYEVGEDDGLPFIAMELLEGTSLREAAAGGSPRSVRLDWLLGAARALAAAHERGLVHRDVKPENMLVEGDGRLKILDFGIAKRDYGEAEAVLAALGLHEPDGPSSLRTKAGRRLGTPRYMAPEQRAGESTDARTDQYAWGLVAFELLTGAMPTPEEDVAAALRTVGLPSPLVLAITRALEERKEDRAPNLELAIQAIEHAQASALTPAAASPRRRALPVAFAAVVLLTGLGLVVRWRFDGRWWPLPDGPPSACRVIATRTINSNAPSGLTVLSDGTVVGSFDADRSDAPATGATIGSVADGGVMPFMPHAYQPLNGAILRGTKAGEDDVLVSLLNRKGTPGTGDPDFALLSLWVGGGKARSFHRLVIQSSGMAVARIDRGLVAAITYEYTSREPGAHPSQYAAGLVWFKRPSEQPLKLEGYLATTVPLDSPAVAVSPSRIALAFRESKKLIVVLVDYQLQRAGDPIVVAEGALGYPAITFLGDTLVAVWPEIASSKTRLRTSSLAPGAKAFDKSRLVSDEPAVLTSPIFVPLATGGSLLSWIGSGAGGTVLRGVRFDPVPSRPFELGRASEAHALAALVREDGASIGWVDGTEKKVVVADVTCASKGAP